MCVLETVSKKHAVNITEEEHESSFLSPGSPINKDSQKLKSKTKTGKHKTIEARA